MDLVEKFLDLGLVFRGVRGVRGVFFGVEVALVPEMVAAGEVVLGSWGALDV